MKCYLVRILVVTLAAVPCFALAQGRDAFIVQQAYAEMQRVQGQISVLQSNLNDLQARIAKLESGQNGQGMRREIDALRAEVASLKRQLSSQHSEIVRDLSGRLAKMQAATPTPQPPQPKKVVIGPHLEYEVQPGDTLSVISQATGVSVRKIMEMNNLKKGAVLRVGQKLMLPK